MNEYVALQNQFPVIRFKGRLRPSQAEVVELARRSLDNGNRRLHIVAPPGSGKTVLGLFLWAQCIQQTALVLSPNSAIQSQWASRTELFDFGSSHADNVVSTTGKTPGLLTSLTYQAVTLPRRGGQDIDADALDVWRDRLIEAGQAENPDEADVWIADLKKHNPDYYSQRLSTYRKEVRDQIALDGDALTMLHQSSLETLQQLRNHAVGLIILDECHHLLGHWGRVLAEAHELFDRPIVLGLTATPPDRTGKNEADVERYDRFFGPIDFEVPLPAVVKDGFLAPYQDLAYFVRPTSQELKFIATADVQLQEIVEKLCGPSAVEVRAANPPATQTARMNWLISSESTVTNLGNQEVGRTADDSTTNQPGTLNLTDWLIQVLVQRRLPTGVTKDWRTFQRRDPDFAEAARLFLLSRKVPLPANVPTPQSDLIPSEIPQMNLLVPVLDRYVRHYLRRSQDPQQHQLAAHITQRLRTLGVQITETGSQPCASPVGRVMAYSRNKAQAVVPILKAERNALGESIRCAIVCDYEKTSAVTAEIKHLLDDQAGGAVAAFKTLLKDPDTDALDPVLVTGSTVLVDDDLLEQFDKASRQWLSDRHCLVELLVDQQDGFHIIHGRGSDWCPRIYVSMITELFQRGVTKCLVGTRGLLGEGWDASKINVLIDLTTVTTSMTVNQLRGRSIRLDPDQPAKLANNWDIVCIAPQFSKGLDDYRRFIAKHQYLYGVTDDGAIEKGVGHVHAALTEIRPEGLEGSTEVLNAEMIQRVAQRDRFRALWQIGRPYQEKPIRALEVRPLGHAGGGFPPFSGISDPWTARSLTMAIGQAILQALRSTGQLTQERPIHVGDRAGGYVRAFLQNATQTENQLFTTALHEAMGPLHRPRYVIPREVEFIEPTWLSKLLPAIVGRFFQRRHRKRVMLHAVPSILAKHRDLVEVYQRYWNQLVSPGEAMYAHRGAGEQLIEQARSQKLLPSSEIHEKDIFL